ncbi:MAG: COG3650 family protein [Microcoleaceae cyanobacterium]
MKQSRVLRAVFFSLLSLVWFLGLNSSSAWAAGAQSVKQCSGTEPFWSLTLDNSQIKFERAGGSIWSIPKTTANSAQGKPADYLALYQGKVREQSGRFLNVIIEQGNCSDGMSDNTYPYNVYVLSGRELYRGCCR